MRKKVSQALAPSTRAASMTSAEMPFNADERMTVQKPVQIHTAATIMDGVAR